MRVVTLAMILLMTMISPARGQADSNIKYPAGCDTTREKHEFLVQAWEALRLEHNAKGDLYEQGLITEEEWHTYLKTDYAKKEEILAMPLWELGQKLMQEADWEVNLNDLEKIPALNP